MDQLNISWRFGILEKYTLLDLIGLDDGDGIGKNVFANNDDSHDIGNGNEYKTVF